MPDIDADAVAAAIAAAITEPASASGDGQSVTAQPLDKMLDALDRLQARQAGRRCGPFGSLRMAKLVPPGAS